MPIILFFTLVLHSQSLLARPTSICEHVTLEDGKLTLNKNEIVLICGSDEGGEAWQKVPIDQAEFHLRTILQNLGYLQPEFTPVEDHLNFRLGPRSLVKSLTVNGADGVLRPDKKRKIIRFPLMTPKLDEVDGWANIGIRSQGYACPDIEVSAQAWSSNIQVDVDLGGQKLFSGMEYDGLDGLDPTVLDRYRPFEAGDLYDIRKTQLMTSRMLSDGLFQSAYFTTECVGDEAQLKLHTSVGKPKILRFGLGASTEEFPFLDVTFRNTRLDNRASFFTTSFHASPREVSLAFGSELYWIPMSDRSFLGPRFKIARLSEDAFESNTASAGGDIGRNWDVGGMRIVGRVGPTLNYTKTLRGTGPTDATYPTVEGSMIANSHVYEYSQRDQYEGWTSQFFYRGQSQGFGSEVNVNRYRLDFKKLWNLGSYSPPLFILGTRFEAIVVDTNEVTEKNRNLLPAEDRIYLGGDQNLRGFSRQSLNNQGLGYLTSVYAGFELRLIEELPYRIQPFLLLDAARLGNRRYTIDKPIYLSQGLGLRWVSPFGTLRGSAAKGSIVNADASSQLYKQQWVYFFSFGQEF